MLRNQRMCLSSKDVDVKRCIVVILLILAFTQGCAYYNTLYNAEKDYEFAVAQRRQGGAVPKERLQKCIERCSKVVALYPKSKWVDDALFLMGKAYFELGDFVKARRKFEEVTIYYPDSPLLGEVYLMLANTHKKLGEDELALPLYKKACVIAEAKRKKELYREAVSGMAELLSGQGREAEAQDVLEQALREDPKGDVDLWLLLADMKFKEGDNEGALGVLERVEARKLPVLDRLRILEEKAAIYTKMGDLDRAIEVYRKVMRDFPHATAVDRVLLGYAKVLVAVDSLNGAMEVLNKLRDTRDDTLRAMVYYLIGQIGERSEWDCDSLQKIYTRAATLEEGKKRAEAFGLLREYSKEEGAKGAFLSAEVYLIVLGDTAEAITRYRSVVDSFPSDTSYAPKALYALVWIYSSLGDTVRVDSILEVLGDNYPSSVYTQEARKLVKGSEP